LNADSIAFAMSYWPRRYSNDKVERDRMPPWAKKSWRFGRFSGEAGVIEMGAIVDIRMGYPMIVGRAASGVSS
jgi:hypothetical protein